MKDLAGAVCRCTCPSVPLCLASVSSPAAADAVRPRGVDLSSELTEARAHTRPAGSLLCFNRSRQIPVIFHSVPPVPGVCTAHKFGFGLVPGPVPARCRQVNTPSSFPLTQTVPDVTWAKYLLRIFGSDNNELVSDLLAAELAGNGSHVKRCEQ